jgi:transposase-like protein
MQPISYARHQFPAEIIRHATWLYLRFTLSYRDVEELLAERGIETSYESIRRWVLKFGPAFARNLRRLRPRPTGMWHLDEMVVSIQGKRMYQWRAVDSEGEVLDVLLQAKRDTAAALRPCASCSEPVPKLTFHPYGNCSAAPDQGVSTHFLALKPFSSASGPAIQRACRDFRDGL